MLDRGRCSCRRGRDTGNDRRHSKHHLKKSFATGRLSSYHGHAACLKHDKPQRSSLPLALQRASIAGTSSPRTWSAILGMTVRRRSLSLGFQQALLGVAAADVAISTFSNDHHTASVTSVSLAKSIESWSPTELLCAPSRKGEIVQCNLSVVSTSQVLIPMDGWKNCAWLSCAVFSILDIWLYS